MGKKRKEKTMSEIWVTVPGFPDYKFSNYGRVKSLKMGKETIINGRPNCNGYIQVGLRNKGDKRATWVLVHRLVADTFLPNIFASEQVNHKDYNKKNNHYTNLEWVTPQENIDWGNGKERTNKQYAGVIQYDLEGNVVAKYRYAAEAARKLGCNYSDIIWALNGNIMTSHGYVWRWKTKDVS